MYGPNMWALSIISVINIRTVRTYHDRQNAVVGKWVRTALVLRLSQNGNLGYGSQETSPDGSEGASGERL